MTAERYLRDPRHGQLVPQGTVIARLIGGILPSIQKDAAKQVRSGIRPNLSHWIDAIVNAAAPVIVPYWQRGYGQRSSDMLDSVRRRARRKSLFATASKIRRGFPVGGSVDISNYLKVAVFSFAQSTLDTVSDQIVDAIKATREALARSATAGETQEAINARLREIFDDEHRADRIGVTEAVRAYNAGGYQAAIDSGIVGGMTWLANEDACDICLKLNGKTVKIGTPFYVHNDGNPVYRVVMYPPAHPHCLLGETPIFAPGAVGAAKANYSGPCVTVELSSGDRFTCTPNHMLLTPSGFSFASTLVEGDDVLYSPVREWMLRGNPNHDRKPTRINEVVHSLSEAGGMATARVPVSAEYLHGDAAFCQGEIDVVGANRFLRDDFGNAAITEGAVDGSLVLGLAPAGRSPFVRDRDFDSMIESLLLATNSRMGRSRDAQAVLSGRSRIASGQHDSGLFRGTANPDADRDELSLDRFSGASESLRQAEGRFAANLVTTTKVIKVDHGSLHGIPVYDVETTSTCYIIGSGVLSSNCKCAVRHELDLSAPIPGPTETHLEEMSRKFKEKPFKIKPRNRWPGGFMSDNYYYENARRVPHPDDPQQGRWSADKPWKFWDGRE